MNNLKIAQNNCHSFVNKFHQIFKLINSERIDVLSLNETFLTPKHTQFNLINNHHIIRCDRNRAKSQEVAIILIENIKHKIIKKESTDKFEFIAIEIFDQTKKNNIVISVCTSKQQNRF